MLGIVALLSVQARPTMADELWNQVCAAHLGLKSLTYKFRLVRFGERGRAFVREQGSAVYRRGVEVGFSVRDEEMGVNAFRGRDRTGEWTSSASDDDNSTSPANNALGYPDSIPGKWSYLPILLLDGEETGHAVTWSPEAPKRVSFRKVDCLLVTGKEADVPIKVWVERKRRLLLRIEETYGGVKLVTAFESFKSE